jgi:pyrroloquinoline quinone (PQQ) biosynthesis protein C
VTTSAIDLILAQSLDGRRLLEHPFYRRWEQGTLSDGELAAYAEQYRAVEAELPEVLAMIAAALPPGPAQDLVAANLADERGAPVAHVVLFESFADAVGARRAVPPTPATAGLIATYRELAAASPAEGLAAVAAYEVQAAEIARTKGDSLRRHYGLDGGGTAFWDLHAEIEATHCRWSSSALGSLEVAPDRLRVAATASAGAWWAFLDEREAAAA